MRGERSEVRGERRREMRGARGERSDGRGESGASGERSDVRGQEYERVEIERRRRCGRLTYILTCLLD